MRSPWIGLTLVAALVAGGCGGDDGPKVKTKADFVAAADRICVKRDESTTKLQTKLSTDDDIARLSGGLADIYGKAIAELQAVPLPPGSARRGARDYVAATVALRKPVVQMKAASLSLEAAIKTRKTAAVKNAGQQLQIRVNTVQALGEVADQSARTYGMRNCGQAATTPSPVS
ncbi:MAG: hypothetical protein QOJ46_547 [bacterium]